MIGAGAAGIAAARRIQAANRKVIVVEAAGQIGGRCLTDTATFEVPFDRGARWLHNPDTNPMIRLARNAGLDVAATPLGQKIRIGQRNARAGETEEFLAALVRANRAIDEASRGKADVSCASVLPKDLGDWAGTAEFVLGASATGKDLRDVSVMDKIRAQERNAAIGCRQGLGTLIARLGEQVPLALSTPASQISWSGRDVAVETPAGKIAARAAIVTVSSNVLAAGNIKFTPEIPKRQLDAAAKLSLGSYDRIALQLPGNPLGLGRDDVIIEQSNSTRTALLFANIGGSSLCAIDVAGSFGRDLSGQGEKAMVAFAVEWLTRLFGSEVAAAVRKSSATRWNASPFTLGAMSVALPGGQPSRKILTEPIGCMFLAGEATHETLWGTVDGAWESGERAAEAALRKIGALSEPVTAPARAPKPRREQERRSAMSGRSRDAGHLKSSRPKALISWSSGKDSAFALHEVRRAGEFDVVGALDDGDRDLRPRVDPRRPAGDFAGANSRPRDCRRASCRSPIPVRTRFTKRGWARRSPAPCAKASPTSSSAISISPISGPIAKQKLAGTGVTPVFPLWERPTLPLAQAMIASGLEAYLATVDLKKLPASFAGRKFDAQLLADLPEGVDPCGENGEFHTCVVAGPMFARRLPVTTGERVERDGYAYCDLVLGGKAMRDSTTTSFRGSAQ